ncbi:hypothetical protein ACF06W_22495 [Streptomyces albus]|uniref:hypothetical protein n=1 Tax=Streptomyces albus TaxID=1888 RepID=UPI0036F55C9F
MRAADRASAAPPHCATVRRGEVFGNAHHARGAVESMAVRQTGRPGRTPGADVEKLRRPLPDDLAGPRAGRRQRPRAPR